MGARRRVFIIGGGGMVGATAAYAIAIRNVAQEIVLIDVAEELAAGQAHDIDHATAFAHGVQVRVGGYGEIAEDDIVVITCGAAQKPGQTRLDLLRTNAAIIQDVVRQVMAQGKPVYILMVANPVDVLTQIALRESGLPAGRVLGTGTSLDTARLRVRLAKDLRVGQNEVQAYILGEHGDSSFVALSAASVAGVPLRRFPGFDPAMVRGLEQDIRRAAYDIIQAKKSTYYGIGNTVAAIVHALQRGTASIFPVCSYIDGAYGLRDVSLGLPSLVSDEGVRVVDGYPLDESELERLHQSAAVLRDALTSVMAPQPEPAVSR